MSALMQLRQLASLAKVEEAVRLAMDAMQNGESVVVATCYVEAAGRIQQGIQKAGYRCELLTGQVKQSDRAEAVERFQEADGDAKAFVFTCGAGGVGITLTRAATMVLVDRALTPGDVEQAEDRCNRIGQTQLVKILWLRAFEVCAVVDTMLEKKQKKIDDVLGETTALQSSTAKKKGKKETGGAVGISASEVLKCLFNQPTVPRATSCPAGVVAGVHPIFAMATKSKLAAAAQAIRVRFHIIRNARI